MMNSNGFERKPTIVAYSGYYPGIFLVGVWETTKTLSLDSRCPGGNSNLAPPKYKHEYYR
jgi:hypothetical protein